MAERRDSKGRLLNKGEYQKNDGRYMYKYTDNNGNSRFVYSWTLTQSDRTPHGKQVEKCLRQMEKEIAKDLLDKIDYYNAKKTTLNDLYFSYFDKNNGLTQSSVVAYKRMYNNHVLETIGTKKITEIKYSNIKNFYHDLALKDELSFSSIKTIDTIIKRLFKIAIKDGYIRLNPCDDVLKEVKKENGLTTQKRRALTIKEQEEFIKYVETHKRFRCWLPLFTFLLGTGCRIGEAIGLTWEDCDFDKGVIKINRSSSYGQWEVNGKSNYRISLPKTESGIREIPMFNSVKNALLEVYKKQKELGITELTIDGYKGFVFLTKTNKRLNLYYVDMAINRIIKNYNISETALSEKENRPPLLLPHFSAHSLRHTFCTRMCENESNIKVIQEIMGHAKINTTMDVYADATLDKKKESFNNLEGLLNLF